MFNFKLMGQSDFRWPFVYFHGDAEDIANENNADYESHEWVAPDLVSCDRKLFDQLIDDKGSVLARKYYVEEGVHDYLVYGHPAVLYLWKNGNYNPPLMSGLICLTDDRASLEYAYKAYSEKAQTI